MPGRARWLIWLRPRRLAGIVLVSGVVAAVAILAEAAVRARLSEPGTRVPTTFYGRPAPWGSARGRAEPVVLGTLRNGLAESRVPIRLDDLPDRLIQAVLVVEDQRFYAHGGLDLRRIAGAAVANVRAGEVTQGGSTITQQLAKNLFLSARRTPLRKLREAAMAVALEDRYEKDRILEAYLNEIYLGQDGGRALHGVGAAARYYFGKDADDLSLAESALLAGMIRAPNYYTPVRHPERARARRDLVLRLMVEQERVSEGAARRARRERIRTSPVRERTTDARYFLDVVRTRLRDEGGRVPERGAAVYTTLDASLQEAAVRAMRDGLASLPARGAQGALVALDPRTGEILALVGGRDYAGSQFNRATDARRQPGSAFKPIVALAALGRDGRRDPAFTLASRIEDEPLSVATPAGNWEPENYDRGYRGTVTFREALEQSLNVPFARIGLAIGPDRIAETGRHLGIESRLRPVPSLALGASEVTPLELARAYGVFATGGVLAETRTVLAVRDGAGRVEETGAARLRQVADPAETYLVTSALEGAVARGTGRGLSTLGHRDGIAGKSGTSSDWRDAWFVAYTPALVVAAWVGYDDGRSLRLTGSRAALPVVARFLREALRRTGGEQFDVPDGVEFTYVGTERGWWGWECGGEAEAFLEGTAPDDACGRRWRPERWIAQLTDRRDELVDQLVDLLERHGDELEEVFQERAEDAIRALAEQLADRARRALREY